MRRRSGRSGTDQQFSERTLSFLGIVLGVMLLF